MTQLEQLPARIDALTSQVSHLRTEMRVEFSAVRSEMAEQGEGLRAEFRTEIRDLATQMRVLHEDVIGRIAQLQEGWPRPPRPRPRKT